MDWSRRASSNWDFTRLEQEAAKSVNTVGGSSSGREFSVDLKLGQVINDGKENGGVGKSSKRARGGGNANQPTACLVDGCASDLRNSRDYHRRHKVCELHSKTPQVSIGGEKQRFCQQCSRFHYLDEFDEGKRSCRKRLDGHNRRRRKPQPEIVPGSANIFSNYQGTQLLSFSSSHINHSTNMAIHDWSEQDYLPDNFRHKDNLFLGSASYPNGYKQGKLLTFQAPACQSLLDTVAITESGEDRTKNLNDRFSTAVRESDCALSLLSSPQTQTSRSSISLLHQHPLGVSLNSTRLEPMDSVLVSSVGNGGMHFSGGLFHLSLDGVVGNEPPPPLPFHWE